MGLFLVTLIFLASFSAIVGVAAGMMMSCLIQRQTKKEEYDGWWW